MFNQILRSCKVLAAIFANLLVDRHDLPRLVALQLAATSSNESVIVALRVVHHVNC